jgi:hypothetical protein
MINSKENDRQFVLLENDYQIISNNEGCLEIKILNENMIKKLSEIVAPSIFITINGEIKIANGMTVIQSALPTPCHYTFIIDIDTEKVRFNKSGLLILTPIESYKVKSYAGERYLPN